MPSLTPSSSAGAGEPSKRDIAALIAAARPFLRDEAGAVPSDPDLPALLSALRAAGAGECWHKHGTFLAHLAGVHRILTLWGAPLPIARCGLYHSAYSNSYVNLAIFAPGAASRSALSLSLSPSAERLVHLFCVVPRQPLIHDLLLFRYPDDAELSAHLAASADPARRGPGEPWRRKLSSLLPPGGITVKHIHTGEDLAVSRRLVAAFLLMTMADFSDQIFGWQDRLFCNDSGRLEFSGSDVPSALWPGDGRPGLWMSSVSRMAAIYNLIVREDEIYLEDRKKGVGEAMEERDDEDIDLVVPPVFDKCTRVLAAEEQKAARDLYWEAVVAGGGERAERLLRKSCERNPFVGEAHVVLSQVYVGMGRWEEAEREAEEGLRLLLEWGTPWDKRVAWEGWVAWGRVLLMKAKEKDWPSTPWGILNLGLVK